VRDLASAAALAEGSTVSSAGKPLPLVFGKVGKDEDDFPKIYERNINVKVIDDGTGKFRIRASLFDLEHSFHAELLVDAETSVIEDATAVMSRRPYQTYCPRALENVAKLKGQVIGAGINRRIIELVGRSQGCVHLVEVFQAAVGFAATLLIGKHSGLEQEYVGSEEEHRKRWMPILRNSCQVFREVPATEQSKK
jgi:hypothetical protein